MVTQLTETTASADWLRARKEQKQLRKASGFRDLIRSVVPVAEVDSGVLKSGRLRAYGGITILSKADQEDELIIAGYASPQVVDREKHVITKEALAKDLPRFMAEPDYRNANLLHSNVQVGKVIPAWVNEEGKRFETKVDEIGLFVVVQIRTDAARPNICRRVAADIRAGKLQAFSISADAPYESRRYECSEGTCFWVIDAVELYEVTVCETPVNQDAKFTILTKSYDLEGEFAPYMWCRDGSCPVTFKQARRTLQKAMLPVGWIETKLDFSFGATEFSAHRNSGTLDDEKRSVLGQSAAESERQSDDPAAPLDLDFPWPARPGMKGRMPISFGEAFNLALADPSGKLLMDAVRKAGYNQPNTMEDEEYYLNEQAGAYVGIAPDGVTADTSDAIYGPEIDVKLNSPEHFHLSLKRDLGQTTPAEDARLDQLNKDNEASGFPPDSGYGQVIIGTDHPNEPELQGKRKQPKLNPPITGSPSIMRSLDKALSEASYLDLSEPMGAIVHKARLDLAHGQWPFAWDASERLFGEPGRWITKGSPLTGSALLTLLRNAAREQRDTMAHETLSKMYRQLNKARPLTLAQAGELASVLAMRAGDSRLDKAASPELALARVRDGVGKITRDPDARQRVPPRLLASLDSILEEAEGAIDGLQLGMTIGLSEDTKLAPRDPKVRYRPAETANERCGACRHMRDDSSCELVAGRIRSDMVCDLFAHGEPEHETIHNSGAGNTYRDVEKTDALLESVTKGVAPQPTQDEAAAGAAKDASAPQHTGAMIAHFLDSGAARQLAQQGGEAADELHITVVYLGEAADFTPEQRRKIMEITQKHVSAFPPIEAEITHIEHFEPSPSSEGKTPVVAAVDADDLHIFRDKLVADLEANGIKIPHDFPTYKPHVTLYSDNPGMDDMQERGIPEVESTPIMVDRLSVTFAGDRHDLSFDAGGATQIHGKPPEEVQGIRKALRSGDEDARSYGALFSSMWSRGFRDPDYQLVVRKADGSIIDLDG